MGNKPYLDFIVVLYFRAVCLKAFNLYKDEVKEFIVENEEDRITTYHEES